ncbi:hypothetical protein HK097_008573 [Rhizophlyctis rosea]|uniref:Uncharacterized protein n=1 Tax=Rhizophlyctis rosea TaxID=64517 RepID=A0AAD5SL55_9FUNG|nr:hypothetical protein HK097_008573 [Rhizophlyctis rosea]
MDESVRSFFAPHPDFNINLNVDFGTIFATKPSDSPAPSLAFTPSSATQPAGHTPSFGFGSSLSRTTLSLGSNAYKTDEREDGNAASSSPSSLFNPFVSPTPSAPNLFAFASKSLDLPSSSTTNPSDMGLLQSCCRQAKEPAPSPQPANQVASAESVADIYSSLSALTLPNATSSSPNLPDTHATVSPSTASNGRNFSIRSGQKGGKRFFPFAGRGKGQSRVDVPNAPAAAEPAVQIHVDADKLVPSGFLLLFALLCATFKTSGDVQELERFDRVTFGPRSSHSRTASARSHLSNASARSHLSHASRLIKGFAEETGKWFAVVDKFVPSYDDPSTATSEPVSAATWIKSVKEECVLKMRDPAASTKSVKWWCQQWAVLAAFLIRNVKHRDLVAHVHEAGKYLLSQDMCAFEQTDFLLRAKATYQMVVDFVAEQRVARVRSDSEENAVPVEYSDAAEERLKLQRIPVQIGLALAKSQMVPSEALAKCLTDYLKPVDPKILAKLREELQYLATHAFSDGELAEASQWLRQGARKSDIEELDRVGIEEYRRLHKFMDPIMVANHVKQLIRSLPYRAVPLPVQELLKSAVLGAEMGYRSESPIVQTRAAQAAHLLLSLNRDLYEVLGLYSKVVMRILEHNPKIKVRDLATVLAIGEDVPMPTVPGEEAQRQYTEAKSGWLDCIGVLMANGNVFFEETPAWRCERLACAEAFASI